MITLCIWMINLKSNHQQNKQIYSDAAEYDVRADVLAVFLRDK